MGLSRWGLVERVFLSALTDYYYYDYLIWAVNKSHGPEESSLEERVKRCVEEHAELGYNYARPYDCC